MSDGVGIVNEFEGIDKNLVAVIPYPVGLTGEAVGISQLGVGMTNDPVGLIPTPVAMTTGLFSVTNSVLSS